LANLKGFVKSNVKGIGKVLLSAFLMKRIIARITQGSGGMVSKYVKIMLVGYLFKKLNLKDITLNKLGKEAKKIEESETGENAREPLITKVGKIIMGVLAGVMIIFVVKKIAAKSRWHEVQVQ
jgi:hypothetical protein